MAQLSVDGGATSRPVHAATTALSDVADTSDEAERQGRTAPASAEHPQHLVAADVAAGTTRPAAPRRTVWARNLRLSLVLSDALCAGVGALLAELLRFGSAANDPGQTVTLQVNVGLGIALPLLWVASLAGQHAYDRRYLGLGGDELAAIVRAFMVMTVTVTFLSFACKVPISRAFVLLALPSTAALTWACRLIARRTLSVLRRSGRATTPLLLVGPLDPVLLFARHLRRDPRREATPVGACIVGDPGDRTDALLQANGLSHVEDATSIRRAAEQAGARAVAVVGSLPTDDLQAILWQLERSDIAVLVTPGVFSITPRRLGIRQVSGVPLVHVAAPEISGGRQLVKGLFDRTASALALAALAPLLLVIAVIVKSTSKGPVLFRQTRIGRDSAPFRMLKFRSMCVDAERLVLELSSSNESDGGVLFKLRQDPRVTRVGAVLRRYSLDELPQLLNVLMGTMSLVGPRPALPEEVARYGDDMRRRLLVKPGITGLWQVGGRSDLPWDEAIRLDLTYVDQWSLGMDARVILQTVGAVLRADGAY